MTQYEANRGQGSLSADLGGRDGCFIGQDEHPEPQQGNLDQMCGGRPGYPRRNIAPRKARGLCTLCISEFVAAVLLTLSYDDLVRRLMGRPATPSIYRVSHSSWFLPRGLLGKEAFEMVRAAGCDSLLNSFV